MTSPAKLHNNYVKGPEVFVGGLPLAVTENKIREVLSDCGEIVDVRLIKDKKGSMKGFCFVKFTTKEAAEKAVKEKNGIALDGKKIGVLPSMEQNTLYFGNLNKGWSANEFEGIVRQVLPDVVSVDLVMQSKSGEAQPGQKQLNRGFALVKFSSHAAASRAYRVGSKEDFTLGGNLHPSVQWAEEGSEVDPDVLAKIKIAFIRNLPTNADENYLKNLFGPFGEIEKVVLWKKGNSPVGFVHFAKRTDLEVAIKEMNLKAVQAPNGGPTCNLSVEVARPMEKNKKRVREESESKAPSINAHNISENTPSAYSISRMSIFPPPAAQQEVNYADPYEAAVVALPGIVKERLLRILRLGIAARSDIDIHALTSLKELPEPTAISVLDQFMLSGADAKDKGIYLAGLIFKHHCDKQSRNELPGRFSRLTDATEGDTGFSNFSSRVLLPDVSRPTHAGTTLTSYSNRANLPVYMSSLPDSFPISRSDDYVRRSAAAISDDYVRRSAATLGDYSAFNRASMGISKGFNTSPQLGTTASSMSYGRNLSPQRPSTAEYYDRLKLNHQVDDVSGFRDRLNATSHLTSADEYRPTQARFDPSHLTSSGEHRISAVEHRPTQVRFDPSHLKSAGEHRPTQVRFDSSHLASAGENRPTQVRFDPYTGEPYKFDPFTGEPIVPNTLARLH